jgi:hypothetical protein
MPAAAHPMDVMRTGVSTLGAVLPEKDDHSAPGARDIADRLIASLGSMLLYWYHWSHNGKRIEVETDDDSIGGHFPASAAWHAAEGMWVRAMHTSLNLYAEHEFNASTFAARVIAGTGADFYSAITGRNRRAARAEARRRQRILVRDAEALRLTRRARKPTSAGASTPRRSSSASGIPSTRSPTRATK